MGTGTSALGWTALRVAVAGAAVAIVLTANIGTALAADDDEDEDLSFEQKIIRNIMHGIGAVDGTEKGIDYRERSPLVVPPKIDLPPPESAKATAPNWPKDPDVEERRKARQAAKNRDKSKEWNQVLTPSEMKVGTARAKTATSAPQPGDAGFSGGEGKGMILSPSQLGFKGFGNIFGGDKPEESKFENEPARESLTQPPSGYQTPSPNYGYGIGATDKAKERATNWQDQNPANQKF
jgi:type IV secretory pathway VirB10-like protein